MELTVLKNVFKGYKADHLTVEIDEKTKSLGNRKFHFHVHSLLQILDICLKEVSLDKTLKL